MNVNRRPDDLRRHFFKLVSRFSPFVFSLLSCFRDLYLLPTTLAAASSAALAIMSRLAGPLLLLRCRAPSRRRSTEST